MRKSEISNEALAVLTNSEIKLNQNEYHLILPPEQLDRKLYTEVNKVLENLGGKWNRKAKAHVFDADPSDAISDACLTGSYTRLDKNGFFPTPKALADEMAALFSKPYYKRVGEFSCGTGNLIHAFASVKSFFRIIAIEPQASLCKQAEERFEVEPYFTYIKLIETTFEDYYDNLIHATHGTGFDAIILNPPFERGQDAAHIRMSIDLLNPQGELVAICSAGLLFRQDRKYKELREFLANNGGTVTQLPEGTFKESGTMVNTVLIYYKNNEEIQTMKNENDEIQTDAPGTAETEPATPKKSKKGKATTENQPTQSEGADASPKSNEADIGDTLPAEASTIYTVTKADGVISEVKRPDVIKAFKGKFDADTVNKQLDEKKVLNIGGETFYSMDRKKLAKFEKKAAPTPETPEGDASPVPTPETPSDAAQSANSDTSTTGDKADLTYEREDGSEMPFEVGDQVINKNGVFGIVIVKENVLRVSFELNGGLKSIKLDKKALENWRKPTPEEVEAEKAKTALAKDEAIQGIAEVPLTEEEKAELESRQETILNAKINHEAAAQTLERTENIMAENISIIRDKNLWRESLNKAGEKCGSFKEYITDVLGFERSYGQNLAQIGEFRNIAKGLTDGDLDISVNQNNALLRGMRKIAEGLGLDKIGFGDIKPVIKSSLAVIGELAKDEETGEVDFAMITPRLMTAAAETILDNVKTDTVEIDGKQMSVEEAKKKGVLDTAFRDKVMTTASEGILTKKEIIKTEAVKRQEENKRPPETTPQSGSTEVYTGALPSFGGGCRTHGKPVVLIGNGRMKTGCECWWVIDTNGKVKPIEVDGKKVK